MMEVHILDVRLPHLPQAAASFGSVWGCCDHQETPTLCQCCMKDGGMWVQGRDVGKDRDRTWLQHPWGQGWHWLRYWCCNSAPMDWEVVLFPGIETPLGWEPAHMEKGSAATLDPPGCAAALEADAPPWPRAEGRGSYCSWRREIWDPTAACAHTSQCLELHCPRMIIPAASAADSSLSQLWSSHPSDPGVQQWVPCTFAARCTPAPGQFLHAVGMV